MAEPIKIGIIGIGRAGWGMHTQALDARPDKFRIVAACDVLAERRERMADRYGCRTFLTVEEMLENPEIELLDVASRSPDHVRHALAGLAAGRHVFLEKPIALSHAEAMALKDGEARSDGRLFIRHNRRFEPAFQHIREIMASGILGAVFEIKLCRHGYQRRDDWQSLISCGGGQLLNWGPHIIDHALRLLESPVTDLWSDLKLIAAVGDAEDHLKIILKGENGRVVDLEISGGVAIRQDEYVVFGTRGALTCDGRSIHLRYLDTSVPLEDIQPDPGTPPLDASFGRREELTWVEKDCPVSPEKACQTEDIWDHLYAALREGADYPILLDEALEVMAVISAVKKGTEFAVN